MRNRVLRSVLAAAFPVMAIVGAWSGFTEAKGDVRANTSWPIVTTAASEGNTNGPVSMTDGAGS